jgi:hypothetical protein
MVNASKKDGKLRQSLIGLDCIIVGLDMAEAFSVTA